MDYKTFFAQDASGNVIDSPSVQVLVAGTETPASGLIDEAGAALSNPFVGGTDGRIAFSAPNGDYDVVITKFPREQRVRVQFFDSSRSGLPIMPQDFMSAAQVADVAARTALVDVSGPIQQAIEFAAATGGRQVFFPPGKYRVANNGTALRIKSGIVLKGAGRALSEIYYDDSASTSRRDCFRVFGDNGTFDIGFEDLAIRSNWGTGDWAQRSHLMELHTTGAVTLRNCRFSDSRFFGTVIVGARSVQVSGCEYMRLFGDGCRPVGCNNVQVHGNYFKDVNDDSVAVHTIDTEASPVLNSAAISGNIIVDSQGIACLGAKHVTISGNTLQRCHTRGILVGDSGSSEGNTALLSVSITGNVVDTIIDGAIFSPLTGSACDYIRVEGVIPTAVPTAGGYVGQPNTAGGINQPFPYFYTNNTDTSGPAAGAWFVNVSNNVCVRTLAPVAQYSDYGFGQRYGRSGPANPAVTDVNLGSQRAAITVENHGFGVRVAGNKIHGTGYGIWFKASASAPYTAWTNCEAAGNVLSNFARAGIYVQGPGHVATRGNSYDGDPYHTHPNRLLNGKWQGASGEFNNCAAVWADTGRVSVEGSSFRNVGTIYLGATPDEASWRANTVYCNPSAGVGWSANNIGIGNMQRALAVDAQVIIEDGDPASATYGRQINVCLLAAAAMPSSGKYPAGYFVRNSARSILGSSGSRYTVAGWWRANTGSSHVAGTDWIEDRCLTGT